MPEPIVVRLAATSMHDRIVQIVQHITKTYIAPQRPYPIPVMLAHASMRPVSEAAYRQLLRRGSVVIATGKATNSGARITDAPFKALINDKEVRFGLLVPENVEASIQTSRGLSLRFTKPMRVVFRDPIPLGTGQIVLADPFELVSIQFTDSVLSYELTSTTGGQGLRIDLLLQQTPAPGNEDQTDIGDVATAVDHGGPHSVLASAFSAFFRRDDCLGDVTGIVSEDWHVKYIPVEQECIVDQGTFGPGAEDWGKYNSKKEAEDAAKEFARQGKCFYYGS